MTYTALPTHVDQAAVRFSKSPPEGSFTEIYGFGSPGTQCADGDDPSGGLVRTAGTEFYGTTQAGGPLNRGTVFKVTPTGQETVLYRFCSAGCSTGSAPSKLIQAYDGDFYGTTFAGEAGAFCSIDGGCGTIFKITRAGALTSLYSFCSETACSDGANPESGVIQATNGNFYGTTSFVGAKGVGTVFRLTPSGTLTTINTFQGFYDDGANPMAGLIQANDGNFFGIAPSGGMNNVGTAFEMTADGNVTLLYSFCGDPYCADGSTPTAALVQDTNGEFYGTAMSGGANQAGTVFRLSVVWLPS